MCNRFPLELPTFPECVAKGSLGVWTLVRVVLVVSSRCRRGVVVAGPKIQFQWGCAERASLTTCEVLFSLALCVNRSFSCSTFRFAAQAQCFVKLHVCIANAVGFAFPGVSF